MQQQRSQQSSTPQMQAQNMVPQLSNKSTMVASSQGQPMQAQGNVHPQMRQQMNGQPPQNMHMMGQNMPQQHNLIPQFRPQPMPQGLTPEQTQQYFQQRLLELDRSALPEQISREFGPLPPHIQTWISLKQHLEQMRAHQALAKVKALQVNHFKMLQQSVAMNGQKPQQPLQSAQAFQQNGMQMQQSANFGPQGMQHMSTGPQAPTMSGAGNQIPPLQILSRVPMLEPTPQELQQIRSQINQPNMAPERLRHLALTHKFNSVKSNPALYQQLQQQIAQVAQQLRAQQAQQAMQVQHAHGTPGQHAFSGAPSSQQMTATMGPGNNVNMGGTPMAGMPQGMHMEQQQLLQQHIPQQNTGQQTLMPAQVQQGQQGRPQPYIATPQMRATISQILAECDKGVNKGPPEANQSPQDAAVRADKLRQLLPMVTTVERMATFILGTLGEEPLRKALAIRAVIMAQIRKDGGIIDYINVSHGKIEDLANTLKRFTTVVQIKYVEWTRQQSAMQQATGGQGAQQGPGQAGVAAPEKVAPVSDAKPTPNAKAPSVEKPAFALGTASPHGVPVYDQKPGGLSADKLHIPARKRQKTGAMAAAAKASAEAATVTSAAATTKKDATTSAATAAKTTASPEVPAKRLTAAQKRAKAAAAAGAEVSASGPTTGTSVKPPPKLFKCKDDMCEYSIHGFEKEADMVAHMEKEHAPVEDVLKFFLENAAAVCGVDIDGKPLDAPDREAAKDTGKVKLEAPTASTKLDVRKSSDMKKEVTGPASSTGRRSPGSLRTVAEEKAEVKMEPPKTLEEQLFRLYGVSDKDDKVDASTSGAHHNDSIDIIADLGQSLLDNNDFDIMNWPEGVDITAGMPSPLTLTPTDSEKLDFVGLGLNTDLIEGLGNNDLLKKAFGGPRVEELESMALARMGLTPDSGHEASPKDDKKSKQAAPELTWENVFGDTSALDRPADQWDKDMHGESIFDMSFLDPPELVAVPGN